MNNYNDSIYIYIYIMIIIIINIVTTVIIIIVTQLLLPTLHYYNNSQRKLPNPFFPGHLLHNLPMLWSNIGLPGSPTDVLQLRTERCHLRPVFGRHRIFRFSRGGFHYVPTRTCGVFNLRFSEERIQRHWSFGHWTVSYCRPFLGCKLN